MYDCCVDQIDNKLMCGADGREYLVIVNMFGSHQLVEQMDKNAWLLLAICQLVEQMDNTAILKNN